MNKETLDLVYCLDENYNIQAITSAGSFLKNYKNKVRIHFLHNNPKSIKEYIGHLEKFKNLEEINIYKFENNNQLEIPKSIHEHVASEATYYRLFMHQFLPQTISKLLYLDCDVITMNEITNSIDNIFNQIKSSKYSIGAINYLISNNEINDLMLNNLGMSSGKYFNAGVLFLDYKKWIEANIGKNILSHAQLMIKEKELPEHDQDILNSYFDGKFFTLDKAFNYPILERFYKKDRKEMESANFIHYLGAQKPWALNGILNNTSKYYQKNYIEIGHNKRHLVFRQNDKITSIIKKFEISFLFNPWKLITFFHVVKSYLFKL